MWRAPGRRYRVRENAKLWVKPGDYEVAAVAAVLASTRGHLETLVRMVRKAGKSVRRSHVSAHVANTGAGNTAFIKTPKSGSLDHPFPRPSRSNGHYHKTL